MLVRAELLSYPLNGVSIELPSLYRSGEGLPVRVKMAVAGHSVKFSSAILYWKESGGAWQSHTINALDPDFHRNYTEDIYLKSIIGASDFNNQSFVNKRYSFKLTVTTDDGVSETSSVRSMEIVKFNYHPNSTVQSDLH